VSSEPVDLVDDRPQVAPQHPLAFFRPKPSPARLVRVGGSGDGAYLVPSDFEGLTACFSPGVANRKSFEDDLAHRLGLRSHLLDFSSDVESFETPLQEGLQFFQKKWLAPADGPDSLSMETWVNESEPGSSELILQMDIEGAEYSILATAPSSILRRFRILVIEFHDFPKRLTELERASEFLTVVEKLKEDFVVVHARANNCCPTAPLPLDGTQIPQVVEFTLLRRDRFEALSHRRLQGVRVPHPKDISRNVARRPPVHLGGSWLQGPRPFAANTKIAVDWFGWFLDVHVRHWPFKTLRWFRANAANVALNLRQRVASKVGGKS
jgi:hypothetical protein